MFMGTPEFAVPSLDAINEHHDIVCVVTKPDKPVGRGHKLTEPPVKTWARSHRDIDLLQPQELRDGTFLSSLERYKPDVIVVIAYGKILPKYILNYPKYGCINVHASLLPKYRGAAPIQWAVINGDEKSGVCTMQMDEGMDTGAVIDIVETSIESGETAGELYKRLSCIGAEAIIKTLGGGFISAPQSTEGVTYAPPITKEMARVNWESSASDIYNLIRGMNPAPIAHTNADGDRVFKVFSSEVGKPIDGYEVGSIIELDKIKGLRVATGDGTLYIKELQEAGGKRMASVEYLRGKKIAYFCNFV